jgi:hypothetical protein
MTRYIHPDAFLTRTFFHRVLCPPKLPTPTTPAEPISEFAIRIGLDEGSGAGDSDLLIYGVPTSPLATSSTTPEQTKIHLRVSRLVSTPPSSSPVKRTPRPDDPAPRPHPLAHLTLNNQSNAHRLGLKRKRSATGSSFSALASACEEAERQRKLGKAPTFALDGGAGGVGLGVHLPGGGRKVDKEGFLIPGTPTRASKKARTSVGAGAVEIGTKVKSGTAHEKGRAKAASEVAKMEKQDTNKTEESEMETNNKTVGLGCWAGGDP